MAGGYFNHYDDPEEFWDEEPLVRKSAPPWEASPAPAPPSGFAQPDPAAPRAVNPFDIDELMQEFAKFHGYTQAISGLMQEVMSAGPDRATARDSTGVVEVGISRAGELIEIAVSDDWRRVLDRSTLGQAVTDAVRNAERKILESTSIAAVDNGTIDRLEALSMDDVVPTKFTAPEPTSAPIGDSGLLLEHALQILSGSPRAAEVDTFVGEVGTESEISVSTTLGRNGIAECVVRIPWGMDVGGGSISWAVKESYDQAYRRRLEGAGHGR
ncbi:hypothetical protein [Nocardia rhizosphaerihabitans]|uniref:YbaB/EbfC DNA-binding family protein n=1 Tax=Nocardia rhizosphaerihabitans TaxID=1691570 RepID=A0ABQ2K9P2_9NOCA|nr:hypothetical protein [Nocardia rhizosphaerihabitans]GGN73813.1 hypothetical protein GCM10011610_16750 [Nocardia rhizosphaerihabitans]